MCFSRWRGRSACRPLDFQIGEESRGKIMRASVLPALVLGAQLIQSFLELYYSPVELSTSGFGGGAPDVWQRVYLLVFDLQFVHWVALASLFALGIPGWSRGEGTWAIVIAVSLGMVSLVLAAFAALVDVIGFDSDFRSDVRSFTWVQLSATFGFLSIGYFFLAYRGLSRETPRRFGRRLRRAPTPGTPHNPSAMEG